MDASVIERRYFGSGRLFYIVICSRCNSVLNSGHHYSERDLHHAHKLADVHNATDDHRYRNY